MKRVLLDTVRALRYRLLSRGAEQGPALPFSPLSSDLLNLRMKLDLSFSPLSACSTSASARLTSSCTMGAAC
eukprot:CAMPEP_0173375250 /NCGR_PEP_ID=MMETSP1144-20121109/29529_1 /TAXON_ID=483371 /ORGANISM="non described non described, Strain CCMP2298" /LENGTH=71 /DNA_ID=CAMNT_0014327675 /DNA_START=877 /DNA_END=1089 /DNA_ORIENTATION=-